MADLKYKNSAQMKNKVVSFHLCLLFLSNGKKIKIKNKKDINSVTSDLFNMLWSYSLEKLKKFDIFSRV